MAYRAEPAAGQHLYVENRGEQTVVTQMTHAPGQQQAQAHDFTTGGWTAPPALFRAPGGLLLRIEAARGRFWLQAHAAGVALLATAPAEGDWEPVALHESPGAPGPEPMPPMEPMKRMEPMKPMEPMRPMELRMGRMSMQMGGPEPEGPGKSFCTQCGQAIRPADRFCGHCGHRLTG